MPKAYLVTTYRSIKKPDALAAYAKLAAKKPDQGADTATWLAAAPEVQGQHGLFWIGRKEHRCRFRDPKAEEVLFKLCAEMSA